MKACKICGASDRYQAILHGDYICLRCYFWALDLLMPPYQVPSVRLVRQEAARTV